MDDACCVLLLPSLSVSILNLKTQLQLLTVERSVQYLHITYTMPSTYSMRVNWNRNIYLSVSLFTYIVSLIQLNQICIKKILDSCSIDFIYLDLIPFHPRSKMI